MLDALLSGDYPRSRALSALLLLIFVSLAFAPFLFPGTVAYQTYSKICVFIVLVASYDILLGYTSIVSFAHTMFFGIGAYAVAIALRDVGTGWDAVLLGTGMGLVISLLAGLAMGLLSLRVRAIFFALVTLAVASGFLILTFKLYTFTGGDDGIRFSLPRELRPSFKLLESDLTGFDVIGFLTTGSLQDALFKVSVNGRVVMYYLLFVICTLLFLLMLRVMNSPFGRVCQAIRENEFRAEAIGYRTVYFRTVNVCLAACIASLAGSLMALATRYAHPETFLSFGVMVNILLMTVIGGMGTLYGAVVGASLFLLAETYLQNGLGWVHARVEGIPLLADVLTPERWLMWLGILFVLSIYFFPKGIVGQLRVWAQARRARRSAGGDGETAAAPTLGRR